MSEEWLPYPTHQGFQVSTLGRVQTPRRRQISPGHINKQGYEQFTVYDPGTGKNLTREVQVMVLETFVGPRPEGMEARHLNGDNRDNKLENLRWGTRAENMQDRLAHGTNPMARKTHCKRNHEFTPENTYVPPSGRQRMCRTCERERQRARLT